MKSDVRILHITDFHLRDPDGVEEHLRKGFFKEYLNPLLELIRAQVEGPIAAVVATGDFVDRGKVANYSHASVLLNYIADGLGLTKANLAVCPGNHDVVYDLERAGKTSEARREYEEFSKAFSNGSAVKRTERALLCKMGDTVWGLMIDTTLGGSDAGSPGLLPNNELDDIVNELVMSVPPEDLLVVGTHFSLQTFPDTFVDYEEAGWTAKHVWSQGYPLKKRIAKVRTASPTLWLCGDSHLPDECRFGLTYYVMTGRLGIAPGPDDSRVVRQAKVICFAADDSPGHVLTFSFILPGHEHQAHYGDWSAESRGIRAAPAEPSDKRLLGVTSAVDPEAIGTSKSKPQPNLELLSGELQEQIISTIRRHNLYTLGRFTTSSDKYTSLSWISMGPLLNEPGLLPAIVNEMARWLRQKFGTGDTESLGDECVLIGIDCWGAVLASQISVLTGAQNFCIGARSHGEHYTSSEKIGERVLSAIRSTKAVVFVTDVVVTGHTLELLYDEIAGKFRDFNPLTLDWMCLSIVADGSQPLITDCTFIKNHCCACTGLPRPVISTANLPDESILAPTLALTGSAPTL